MPIRHDNWTIPELLATANEAGLTVSLDLHGRMDVHDASGTALPVLVNYLTERRKDIEQYLRAHR